jgi:hypothetical protein
MRSTEVIKSLADDEIFVFGSNYAGRHGKGAALQAVKFGAIRGQGVGLMGKTYGIATKDRNLKVLPLESIKKQIAKFLDFARENKQFRFLVTPIGCGLAGYRPRQIAPLFYDYEIPDNVFLPESFKGITE